MTPSTAHAMSPESSINANDLKEEVRGWAERIGVVPREIHVRPMTRKWGSCSTTGRLTLSTDLVHEPKAFRSEVIAHELLHLRIPNHGRVFKALLRSYLGMA